MIRLVSFDVWDTLLSIDVMLEFIAKNISYITGKDLDFTLATMYTVRRRIKVLRREKKIPADQLLSFSQDMLAEALDTDVECIKRGIAKTVLDIPVDKLVIKDAPNILKLLKQKGYTVIVLGNVMFWPSAYTRLLLEKTGLAEYIDKQYYSDEIKYYKPLKEAFLKPLNEFKVKTEEAIHVGDSLKEDYEGAIEAGLYAALINKNIDKEYVVSSRKGFVIKSISYLAKVIELINSRDKQE